MEVISAFIMLFLTMAIAIVVATQAIRGTTEILSTRNLFLLGLIIFQITGPAASILSKAHANYQPAELSKTSVVYTFMIVFFTGLFLLVYNKSTGPIDKIFSRRHHVTSRYSPTALMTIAVVTLPAGLICQYGLSYIPIIGPGFRMFGYGMYAVASGLACWVWFKKFYNPVYMFLACSIILLAMGFTFYENFGRRPLLGIIAGVGWAAYYSHWRSLGLSAVIKRGVIIAGIGFFLLALVTSTRQGGSRDQTAMQNISALKDGSFASGSIDLLTGQEAGMNSMWIIETRPTTMPYDTLHSIKLVLAFPVPRSYWPNKPEGLSITIPQKEMRIEGMARDWNIGPGLIGHIENDNPFIALWLYPIILGVYFRVLDRVVVWFPDNPFAIIPIGAALGQFIAMPRGELGSFFFIATLNIVASICVMFAISLVLKLFGFISPEDQSDSYDDDHYPDYHDSLAQWYEDDSQEWESS